MTVLSSREIFKLVYAKEKALSKWTKETMHLDGWPHYRGLRHWQRIPDLSDCLFETGVVPGFETMEITSPAGYRPDLLRILRERVFRPNYLATCGDRALDVLGELELESEGKVGPRLVRVRLDFEFVESTLRVFPSYTGWRIPQKPKVSKLRDVMCHWQYKVGQRSASKALASHYAGSALRRMIDTNFRASQSEVFRLRDRLLMSHRFTEPLWSDTHLLKPQDAVDALVFNSPMKSANGGRFCSVGELIQSIPEHGRFFEEVVSAWRGAGIA